MSKNSNANDILFFGRVKKYNYLETVTTENNDNTVQIKCRIKKAHTN